MARARLTPLTSIESSEQQQSNVQELLGLNATEYDDEFVLKLLTMPGEFFMTYEPPEEVLQACPDPDPRNYAAVTGLNDPLFQYLEDTNRNIPDLSWAECLVLSRGHMPHSAAGRLLLGQFIYEATAETRARQEIERHEADWRKRGINILRGLRVGRILSLQPIPESNSGQKLALVHVGMKTDHKGVSTPDIRQIICGGTDVLKPDHKVVVALPGAITADFRKFKARRFKMGNSRYKSDGMLCSESEAAPAFRDFRIKSSDQVLILPDHPALLPGVSLDHIAIRSLYDPFGDFVIQECNIRAPLMRPQGEHYGPCDTDLLNARTEAWVKFTRELISGID